MLDAFKIKSFDLQPIYEEWKDGPVFNGNPKKDPPVEEWLDKIKEGCVKRGVPEEYWYKVAQHFMGPKAKARLDELKEVIRKVHGGKYRWTWKKFRIAVLNMGWNIDKNETRTIKVPGKLFGLWLNRKRDGSEATLTEEPEPSPVKESSRPALWPRRRSSVSETAQSEQPAKSNRRSKSRPPVKRGVTEVFSIKEESKRPVPTKARSETTISTRSSRPRSSSPQKRAQTTQVIELKSPETSSKNGSSGGEVATTTQAPVWLLNACSALDFITSEHPKAMSVLSAILITVGSIPAIPAISAGAGGAVLASGAAHAIGAIAVGVGQALSLSVKNSEQRQQNTGDSNSNLITNH